ncbi:hypothetical protein FOA43_000976 [Brettanomyces nanus]|uniref:C2H2-type domain-containing protein n=1 Tax=Eeniella nana TaxID=13502 RepID=A0A875RYG5_EENNA|nr:uncharacterized protein FOA43_000976 [Brettanomyces nanus]QPG73663.1 hypothetical protein FOA43_000976 [Brettanomyces nanus]
MASTLKRTLTDIMEDELYSPASQNHNSPTGFRITNMTLSAPSPLLETVDEIPQVSQASQIPRGQQIMQIPQPSQGSHSSHPPQLSPVVSHSLTQEDLSRYIHLNGSQDSLERNISTPSSPKLAFSTNSASTNKQPVMQHLRNEPFNTTANGSDNSSIYNEYGNPNIFAHASLPDELYSLDSTYSRQGNDASSKAFVVDPHDTQKPQESNQVSSAAATTGKDAKRYDDIDDDVMLVPQENYLFDQADSQYFPNILHFEFGTGKPFPQSNELNIFRSNDVYVDDDFSEDDEDDEDVNKLDDMEMDLDDASSESSAGEEEEINNVDVNSNANSESVVEGRTPADFIKNASVSTDTHPADSIYSLTFGNRFNGIQPQSFKPLFAEDDDIDNDSDTEMTSPFEIPDVANQAIKHRAESFAGSNNSEAAALKKQRKKATLSTDSSLLRQAKDDPTGDVHICTVANPKTGLPCNKRFSRPYDLVRHQNTIHASRRSYYRCMFCEDDLRRKHDFESDNEIVMKANYRATSFSMENSNNNMANSHNSRKVKASSASNGYLSNKTFSRCDALTRHLRFRHGLNNEQVNDAMDYAKKHVEFYNN